jgi:hypothetical protein
LPDEGAHRHAGLRARERDVELIVLRADAGGQLIEPRWARPSMLVATARTSPVDQGPVA